MQPADSPELAAFLGGERDLAGFTHREHVRMAYELLRREEFAEAVPRYTRALRVMLARAGRPEAFHLTVTMVFLALIAEALERAPAADFEAFAREHPELLDKSLVSHWYRPERLASPAARRAFLLPDLAAREPG